MKGGVEDNPHGVMPHEHHEQRSLSSYSSRGWVAGCYMEGGSMLRVGNISRLSRNTRPIW